MAAELMRRSDDLGTLEAGKIADLIAVDHDPLGDPDRIGDPDTVRLVVKDGAIAKDSDARGSSG